jgi:hypothetical protein
MIACQKPLPPKSILCDIKEIAKNENTATLSNLTFNVPPTTTEFTLNKFTEEGYLLIKGFCELGQLEKLNQEVSLFKHGLRITSLNVKLNHLEYTDCHELGMALLQNIMPGLQPPEGKQFFVVLQVMHRDFGYQDFINIHQDPGVAHFLMPLSDQYLNTLCLTPKALKDLKKDSDFAYLLNAGRIIHDEKTLAALEPIQSKPGNIAVFSADQLQNCLINNLPLDQTYPKHSLKALWHTTPSETMAKAKSGDSNSDGRYLLGISIQLKDVEDPSKK